jgi:myo-inositol-1-phosphate synthase
VCVARKGYHQNEAYQGRHDWRRQLRQLARQGVSYYRQNNSSQGLIHDKIGGYGAGDVDFVLGIDVDARKVGKDISEAIFAAPNNTKVFQQDVPATGVKVIMGRFRTALPRT